LGLILINEYWGRHTIVSRLSATSEKRGAIMLVRQLTIASLLSLPLISLPGSAHAQAGKPLAFCKADAARLCPGIAPGGGKLIGCLKQHENEVSIGCAKELKAVKAKMGK
jgi:hypothetical protein